MLRSTQSSQLPRRRPRRAAALVSAVAILLVVSAFAALLLSVHSVQLFTNEAGLQRLRAHAAALSGTHLALWRLHHDTDLQEALARAVQAADTSYAAEPLFHFSGALAGAAFETDVWPGADRVRVRSTGRAGQARVLRWAQMPIVLATGRDLLMDGDFEDPARIDRLGLWLGAASLGRWLAVGGISQIDDPHRQNPGWQAWNISSQAGTHIAEHLAPQAVLGQYVSGEGVSGPLTLEFDYLRSSGNLAVSVRGIDTLPSPGLLFYGLPAAAAWATGGTLLYDSGNLPHALTFTQKSASIDIGAGYRYYAVFIEGRGGWARPQRIERAVDNLSLRAP